MLLLASLVISSRSASAFVGPVASSPKCSARLRTLLADPLGTSDDEVTEDEISEAIRGLSLEELEAASSELTSEDLEGTDAKELGPDALGDPEAAAAANAGAEWIGEFDGRDDDFDASWRKEAEELIFAAASDVGVEIADVTWDLDKLKLTVAENLDAEDVSRATQAVIRALEVEDERLRILDRHELEVGTPGATDVLQKQRDFVTFKGFDVLVDTENPIEPGQKRTLQGSLVERNSKDLVINQKGRMVKIPYYLVEEVRLVPAKVE